LGANSTTAAVVNTMSATIGGKANSFSGTSATSKVSVGSAGNERTITNVASGRVSATWTDAVVGSQLFVVVVQAMNQNTSDVSNVQGSVTNLAGNVTNTRLGCSEVDRSPWGGTRKSVCSKGFRKASTERSEMRRCRKYKERAVMTDEQSAQIEELLLEWDRWQIRQAHVATLAHFYWPEDHTCRGYKSPANADEARSPHISGGATNSPRRFSSASMRCHPSSAPRSTPACATTRAAIGRGAAAGRTTST
jgi:hypothetical protein